MGIYLYRSYLETDMEGASSHSMWWAFCFPGGLSVYFYTFMDTPITKKKSWINQHPKITVAAVIVVLILLMASGDSDTKQSEQTPTPDAIASKQAAQTELDALIDTSKAAGLVTSYEFSDSATEVFVGKAWYSQTVQFKKDFIAKIGILKKAITGYSHFELKDAYSNEKVGEIDAFSQSVEVYK